ncbi:MAG TPA: hypothetical protein VED40_14130 [Azospirillaceae bacterium]|nr:hypothetical protein [Azospirillaceae bacterium]
MRRFLLAISALLMVSACEPSEFAVAKNEIAKDLRDPDSVQFRNVRMSSKEENYVCLEYNAKNAFGAYVGYKSAAVFVTSDAVFRFHGASEFPALFNKYCG